MTVLISILASEGLIFLYAYYIKVKSMDLAHQKGNGNYDVLYESIVLESYSSFTYFIYIIVGLLLVFLGVKLNFKFAVWKWFLSLFIGIIVVVLNLYLYKFYW